MKIVSKFLLVLSLTLSQIAFSLNYSMQYSELAVSHNKAEGITAKEKATPGLLFSVTPKDGYAFNFEGPWALKIMQPGSKTVIQTYNKKDLEKEKGDFLVDNEKAKKIGASFDFELVAFICTKDKSKCFREVFKGSEK